MHAHTITYENFNGETKTKTLNFNLTEAELTKLQKDYLDVGGIQVVMQQAIDSEDTKQLLDFFELLVHRSFGIKSADGEQFEKSPEIMASFENSAYYSDLYMSFFGRDGEVGQEFIRKVMPAALIAKAEANVRGEGELNRAAERAKAAGTLRPDAREAFARAQAEREEEKTRNLFTEPQENVVIVEEQPQPQATRSNYEQPSERYEPGSQPDYPRVQNQDFRVPAEEPEEQKVFTKAQWEAQQAEREGNISRPRHESGPGYEQAGGNGL